MKKLLQLLFITIILISLNKKVDAQGCYYGASATWTINGGTVSFVNTSTMFSTSYWDFGDGTTSNLHHPVHTYSSTGNYVVTLSITYSWNLGVYGSFSCSNSGSGVVTISTLNAPANVFGCTDPTMFNYNPAANLDDGSCVNFIYGCTDSTASNYTYWANTDDGSCMYCPTYSINVVTPGCPNYGNGSLEVVTNTGSIPSPPNTTYQWREQIYLPPYGSTTNILPFTGPVATGLGNNYYIVDILHNNGCPDDYLSWQFNSSWGCTDPLATNYNSSATCDDGSCIYPIYGCMDSSSTNYNPLATIDDGSCVNCPVPTDLISNKVVHSRATFNWTNNGSEYYKIRIDTGSGWSILTQIGAADGFAHPNTSKTKYFLTPNTTYEWQVRGWCLDSSVSNWSPSATLTTLDECPNATNLNSTNTEAEWNTISWDAAMTYGVDHYLARVREIGSNSWNIKGNIGNGLSKTIGSLTPGATYEFETRTWCKTGDANNPSDPYYKSDWGGNGQFTTVPCPVQTDNLGVTQLTATSADFSWILTTETPTADHFTIRFREIGATTWNYRSVAGGGTATGRTIGGFTSGVDYEWEVRTFCGVGSTWKSP
ncbi:MAG: hypothetical protein CMP58_04780, partial [Flavobacteriales bacterium]|nr:hypothetical protein [Flavobacteriales bacterium]